MRRCWTKNNKILLSSEPAMYAAHDRLQAGCRSAGTNCICIQRESHTGTMVGGQLLGVRCHVYLLGYSLL